MTGATGAKKPATIWDVDDHHIPSLPHALEHVEQVTTDIDGRRPAVFLDYDGTLTPIVDDPHQAVLSDESRRAIKRLATMCPVAIVSGRDLPDARAMLGLDDLVVAGSHGFDMSGPGWEHQHEAGHAAIDTLRAAADDLENALAEVAGIQIERKKFAVTVHIRQVDPAQHREVAAAIDQVVDSHPGLRRTGGKMIYELRPDHPWDKGRALEFLLEQLHLDTPDVIPLYLGDDETDEDALRAVRDTGIGIVVGTEDRPTAARYRLDNPFQVQQLLEQIAKVLQARRYVDPWELNCPGFDPEDEGQREALCTLGNGYVAIRGALPEACADEISYPGAYLAGVFNRLPSEVAGRQIHNEDMVNAPNPLSLTWRHADDDPDWFDLRRVEVLDHGLALDMRSGVLTRRSRVRDRAGRTTSITQRRLVSMDDPHLVFLETTVEAEDWSGIIEVRSMLDGSVTNSGVARYRKLANQHLRPVSVSAHEPDLISLEMETNWSGVKIAQAARTSVHGANGPITVPRHQVHETDLIADHLMVDLQPGRPVTIDKVIAIHTSRDHAVGALIEDACHRVRNVGRFDELLAPHRVSWQHIWNRCRVEAEVDPATSMAIHLHMFHLNQTVSKHSAEVDAGIPARGLHGEAYRGHVFWDELFILPFLSLRLPGLARGHLMYRYRRLGEARRAAAAAGFEGAMFPWQSGSTGREETQTMHLNPASGRWLPDGSHLQRHIGAAVVYDVWQYHQATADTDFLAFHGAEMILEVARFWASITEFDPEFDRYRIRGVMGPDEYHESYPDADAPGLDDNAYTNVMAVWCLERGARVLDDVGWRRAGELCERLGLTETELARWEQITRKMRICFHDGVISQFDGYEQLEELDWERYRRRYGDIARLDRILEAEGDSTDRYKLSKQADVTMLFFLLSAEELRRIFHQLGYEFDADLIHRTIDYYGKRTSHGSTLSRVVDAWVLSRRDRPRSWNTFLHALRSDLYDVQGGTTAEGIHLGAMAGTVDLLQRCYTGIEARDDALWLSPSLPAELPTLTLDIRYRRRWLVLEFTCDCVSVEVMPSGMGPINIGFDGKIHQIAPGERCRFDY
jgi:alpha,alpha-trehalase